MSQKATGGEAKKAANPSETVPWVAFAGLMGASLFAMQCLGANTPGPLEPIASAIEDAKEEASNQLAKGMHDLLGSVNGMVQRALSPDVDPLSVSSKPAAQSLSSSVPAATAQPKLSSKRSSKRPRQEDESTRQMDDEEEEEDNRRRLRGDDATEGVTQAEAKAEPRQTRTTRAQVAAKPAKPVAVSAPKHEPKREPKRSEPKRRPAKKPRRTAVDIDEDREVKRNDPPLVLKAINNETICEIADLLKVDVRDLLWLNKWAPEYRPLKPGTSVDVPFVDLSRWKNESRVRSRLMPALYQATEEAKGELEANDEEYTVERILKSDEVDGLKHEKVYYVRWKGYGADSDTWEPEGNLQGCSQLIADYEKRIDAATQR